MRQKGRLNGDPRRVEYERELRAMRYAFRWNSRVSHRMRLEIPERLMKSRYLKWLPSGTRSRLVKLIGGSDPNGPRGRA
jgi:hypothetical protein